MINKSLHYFSLILFVSMSLSACSVNKATSVKKYRNLQSINPGYDQRAVHKKLGIPKETRFSGSQFTEVYELTRGSVGWGYTRATLYTFLDVATVGLWELIGTPLEDFIQTKQIVRIDYDENKQVSSIDRP